MTKPTKTNKNWKQNQPCKHTVLHVHRSIYTFEAIRHHSHFKNGNSLSPIVPKLGILVRIFSPPKNKNIQPRFEKQHSYKKKSVLKQLKISKNSSRRGQTKIPRMTDMGHWSWDNTTRRTENPPPIPNKWNFLSWQQHFTRTVVCIYKINVILRTLFSSTCSVTPLSASTTASLNWVRLDWASLLSLWKVSFFVSAGKKKYQVLCIL